MKRSLLAALTLSLAGQAFAAFEDLGAGARAPGLGGAFTALADDSYAPFYNPAGLAQLQRSQFSASYSRLYMGLSDGSDLGLSQFAYAHPLKGGRQGTLATSFERFSLGGLYNEQTIYFSYGRILWVRDSGAKLLGGLNAKYLSHSFSAGPEAANACNLQICDRGADPVLSGSNSKSVFDADLGLLYRFPRRFQIGLFAQHLLKPDVGFASSDKLPMNIRTAAAYKSLWMTLSGELRMNEAPDGSQDKDFIVAAERFFPTLDYGQFGVRGSLGLGTRDWRQITTGLSYRINKIQFDYAFLMPIGTVKGTAGNHRMSVTFHFGAPTAEDEISKELIEKARMIREGKGLYGYEFVEELKPQDLNDPQLAEIKRLILEGHFRKAHHLLSQKIKDLELSPTEPLATLGNRLDLIASYYPDLSEVVEAWEIELSSGIHHFINARDRSAILHVSYALSLNSNNSKLDHFLGKLEAATEIAAHRLPAAHPRNFVDELLYKVEAANNRRDYHQVLQLLQDIEEIDPTNVTALERVGSTYFVLGKYDAALATWRKALPLEIKPKEIEALKEYMKQAEEKLGRKEVTLPGGITAPVTETLLKPAGEAAGLPTPAEAEKAALQRVPGSRGDPRDISALYQRGVEHYARGEYLQATAMFLRILQIDPSNAQAKKALARIEQRSPKR
ncbi:MAG: hypothetical protein HY549_00985 [Elusimicrobia bacterium]|nr:hypothetical protein [Elusimicrobiota bacterium]